jgi:NTP pyrophosphatase (non-canonical NTP hydrolase)
MIKTDLFTDGEVMELKDLEKRMHEFVASKGWYAEETPKQQSPRNLAISLSVEAAEILEHFQWRGEILDKEAFASELADVALYLIQLASISGVDLEQAILDKLAANQERSWPEP